jgi:hypothetical protein
MKSSIFTTAWQLFKGGIFATFAEALKAAWNKSKLQSALKSGVAYFKFTKADGKEREAIGTLHPVNFQYENKGSQSIQKPGLVKFWDVEKRAFRSFNIENFIGFILT